MNKNQKPEVKAKQGLPLHQYIATGGKPKDYDGCKGVNATTVTGIKSKKNK